jgi:adenine deaminase
MATINTAERFGLQRDIGAIVPGNYADIILLDGNLADVNVVMTIAAGVVVAENGRMTVELAPYAYPEEMLQSVRLEPSVAADWFAIKAPVASGEAGVRAIEVRENHVETNEIHVKVPVENGQIALDPASGLCKIAVLERHHRTGNRSVGLVANIRFRKPAAIAMTVAHDSHNVLVIGSSDELMAEAANAVIRMQGGVAVMSEEGAAEFPLRIAGLMSTEPFETVAEQSASVSRALAAAGCDLNYAFMTLSLLALVVIPTLRISDKGLVRISAAGIELVPLFLEETEQV